MLDFLDIINGKIDKTLEGTWYQKNQPSPQDAGQPFDYEIIDPKSRSYQMLIGNLSGTGNVLVIKTNDPYEWKEKTFVALQDERLYIIESIREDLENVNKEAFRLLKDVIGIEYILRLIEVDNPYGLK
jgi:predicted phosphatase